MGFENPLPPNPEGVTRLQAAVAQAVQAPAPQPVGALPEIAQAISGKTYIFEPNPQGVNTFRVEFTGPITAVASLTLFESQQELTWEISLDGSYRLMADGSARRGGWVDAQTFVFEVVDVETWTYRVKFEGENVVIESPEVGIHVEGKQEKP